MIIYIINQGITKAKVHKINHKIHHKDFFDAVIYEYNCKIGIQDNHAYSSQSFLFIMY